MEAALRRIYRTRQAPGRQPAATHNEAGGTAEELRRFAAASREKDALLRECHHSVNNNMQLVSSLLQLQANVISHPETLEAFQEFAGRIRVIALIHQRLNRAGAAASVDLKACLETIADALLRAQSNGVKVRRQFDMETVAIAIDTAIPVGLIANEVISHGLKHAFAGQKEGLVRISLSRGSQDQFRLAIDAGGCGAAESILEGHPLGLRLVKVLTGQIRGQVEYKNGNGAEFVLVFKDTSSIST